MSRIFKCPAPGSVLRFVNKEVACAYTSWATKKSESLWFLFVEYPKLYHAALSSEETTSQVLILPNKQMS